MNSVIIIFLWSIWSLSDAGLPAASSQQERSLVRGCLGEWSCSDRETVFLFLCFSCFSSFFKFFALYCLTKKIAWWSQITKRGSAYIVAKVLGTAKHKKMIFFFPLINIVRQFDYGWLIGVSGLSSVTNKNNYIIKIQERNNTLFFHFNPFWDNLSKNSYNQKWGTL